MTDNTTLVEVSAFAGLAGALLTQIITFANTYLTDKRKQAFEINTAYRNKKIEIGESYYYINGEIMSVIKKNIEFWKNRNSLRSEASLESMNKEVKKFTMHLEKLNAENWKYNLIGLYFKLNFDHDEIQQTNALSRKYHLLILDIISQITTANEAEKNGLYGKYAIAVFDMCGHYEQIYQKMEADRNQVKDELLQDYAL